MGSKLGSIKKISMNTDIATALAVIGMIAMFVLPLPPILLDILLTFSLAFSLVLIMLTLFTVNVLQLSSFPTLLLISTVFRLGLNISATRLILTDGNPGEVIKAFGNFVVGGNYAVGVIIFIIIFIIQLVVITNGSGRVAEVAARFTLDAMPGKQMSIDADLNAGIINEKQAMQKRMDLQQEADFYGSMDGASKFIKGDAIAEVIVVLVDIIGGLIIGITSMNLAAMDALKQFTLLAIGNGLVNQLSALLMSTAAGILVTRSSSGSTFGKELSGQLTAFPNIIAIASVMLFLLGMVPSMPTVPFFILSASTGFFAYTLKSDEKNNKMAKSAEKKPKLEAVKKEPENIMKLIQEDMIKVEIGYGLIPLADSSTGDLLERVTAVRRQCAMELGLVVQPIRIKDNLQLGTNKYVIKIKGIEVADGEILSHCYLAMDPANSAPEIEGVKTREPVFNLPAVWITEDKKDKAEMMGLTVVDPLTILVTHLTEVIKQHSYELLGRQEVKMMIDSVKENYSAVVDELIPDLLSIGDIQKVLQNLLKEKIPIKDLVTILESLADNAKNTKDIELLTEYVRYSLGRVICQPIIDDKNTINVIMLSPKLEQLISSNIRKSFQGSFPSLSADATENILSSIKSILDNNVFYNNIPVMLCSPGIRIAVRKMLEMVFPQICVISINEVPGNVSINSVGVVSVDEN